MMGDSINRRVVSERRRRAIAEAWQERLHVAVPRPGWNARAACRAVPVERFDMSSKLTGAALDVARALCDVCPVRLSCLGAARIDEQTTPLHLVSGMRGGLTANQRVAVYRQLPRYQRDVEPCPSNAAYVRHLRDGQTPCDGCRFAHADYTRDAQTSGPGGSVELPVYSHR